MDKLDLLKRRIATQYDEDFAYYDITPTEEQFNAMADKVRSDFKIKALEYTDAEFLSARDQIRESRPASIGMVYSLDNLASTYDMTWFTSFCEANGKVFQILSR